jgi:hypothetical protein
MGAAPYDSRRGNANILLIFVVALLLGAAALAAFLRQARTGLPARIAELITRRSTTFDTSVPTVVERIQTLKRLETVVYSLDTVVEGERSNPILPDMLDSRSIHVNLPESEIFVTTLDNQHTRVYARTTGLLVPADRNLETETRIKAQQQLQAAALSDGILDAARRNARATVSALLYSLGFTHVEVT